MNTEQGKSSVEEKYVTEKLFQCLLKMSKNMKTSSLSEHLAISAISTAAFLKTLRSGCSVL